jgi:hypothetical protein
MEMYQGPPFDLWRARRNRTPNRPTPSFGNVHNRLHDPGGHGHDKSSRPRWSKTLIAIFRRMRRPNAIFFVRRPSRLGEGLAPPLVDDAPSIGGKPVEDQTASPEIPDASL